jgi:hypothetical protein
MKLNLVRVMYNCIMQGKALTRPERPATADDFAPITPAQWQAFEELFPSDLLETLGYHDKDELRKRCAIQQALLRVDSDHGLLLRSSLSVNNDPSTMTQTLGHERLLCHRNVVVFRNRYVLWHHRFAQQSPPLPKIPDSDALALKNSTEQVVPLMFPLYKNPDDTWIANSPVRKEIVGLAKRFPKDITAYKHKAESENEASVLSHLRDKACGKGRQHDKKPPPPECGASDRSSMLIAETWVRRDIFCIHCPHKTTDRLQQRLLRDVSGRYPQEWQGWDAMAEKFNTGRDPACDVSCHESAPNIRDWGSQSDSTARKHKSQESCEASRAKCVKATGKASQTAPMQRTWLAHHVHDFSRRFLLLLSLFCRAEPPLNSFRCVDEPKGEGENLRHENKEAGNKGLARYPSLGTSPKPDTRAHSDTGADDLMGTWSRKRGFSDVAIGKFASLGE